MGFVVQMKLDSGLDKLTRTLFASLNRHWLRSRAAGLMAEDSALYLGMSRS